MDIENLVKLLELISDKNSEAKNTYKLEHAYFIRTLTFIFVGEVVKEDKESLFLKNVSLIADMGRVSTSMSEGLGVDSNCEIECYPKDKEIRLYKQSFIESFEYDFSLPEKTM